MEEKQLDFNAPLMSVRRFSSEGENSKRTQRPQTKNFIPPPYKSDLKSGPVINAGNIPFQWEQIPGRPKDREGSHTKTLAPLAPKLPPGRILDVKPSSEDKDCENSPRLHRYIESSATSSNVPPRGSFSLAMPLPVVPLEHKVQKQEDVSDTDDCDAFSDALETLSRSESVFLNCSLSGVSGWDNPDMKPADPQSRKFMMDRFLPAAKAMASESPQHTFRKQPAAREPVREMNRVNRGDDRGNSSYSYQVGSSFVPNYSPEEERNEEDEEDSDEDDDNDDAGNLSAKACGLLPRSLKNSLCLLNPVFRAPGMKVRRQIYVPSAANKSNLRLKASDHGSPRETDEENTWEAVYKHKLVREIQNNALHEDGSKRTSESSSTRLGNGMKQLTYWSDSQTPDGSSPYRHSTGGISPYRNEAPQSPFQEGASFLGLPNQNRNCKADGIDTNNKRFNNYNGISSHGSIRSSDSGSPTTEKTLYVDSVQMLPTPNSKSDSSGTREFMLAIEYKDSETLVEGQRSQGSLTIEDSIVDKIDHLDIMKASEPERDQSSATIGENNLPSFPGRSNLRRKFDRKGSRVTFVEDLRHVDCSSEKASSSGHVKEQVNCCRETSDGQESLEVEIQGNSFAVSLQSLLPPPLPKSPSESWLLRTLSAVPTPKPSSRSLLGVRHHSSKHAVVTSSADPTWEAIVKTSNVHHNHLRFSEELIPSASQNNES